MAKDVRAALVRAFADVKGLDAAAAEAAVAGLERSHRYSRTCTSTVPPSPVWERGRG